MAKQPPLVLTDVEVSAALYNSEQVAVAGSDRFIRHVFFLVVGGVGLIAQTLFEQGC